MHSGLKNKETEQTFLGHDQLHGGTLTYEHLGMDSSNHSLHLYMYALR